MRTILVTGGTGMVGRKVVSRLVDRGYQVNMLIRGESQVESPSIKTFKWDIYNKEIDPAAIQNVDAIIHLAGENIGKKRWTTERKQQLLESRTESIRMIYGLLRKNKHHVERMVSASAVGYYGNRKDEILREESLPAKDFLAETCIAWEQAVDEGAKFGLRIAKLRTGVVLDRSDGIIPQLVRPLKFGLAAIPGSGDQWMSWIHVDDLVNMYIWALENGLSGAYNATAPDPVRLGDMIDAITRFEGKSPLFVRLPEFLVKAAAGEMAMLPLFSTRTSADKIISKGYHFLFPTLGEALENLYKPKA